MPGSGVIAPLLLWGDSERNPSLRHEVPVSIGDPLMLVEDGGRTWIMSSDLERERLVRCRPDAELVDIQQLGLDELVDRGLSYRELEVEFASRLAARAGIAEAIVEFEFPLAIAERLRADGIALRIDDDAVAERRRRKTTHELAGIRRAQAAAEVAIRAAATLLGRAELDGDRLSLDSRPLTAERIRAAMRDAAWEAGAVLPPEVIVSSVWQGRGHDPGSGPLPARLPIVIDVWPRDTETACWADMTRTFVVGGEPPDEVRRQEQLVRRALTDVYAAVRPGVTGRELHNHTCDLFEAAGYPTQRTSQTDGSDEGFQFSLGHGVGLQVHEAPALGRTGSEPLVAGDVLAVEPGLWRNGVGSVRLEDLILVTDGGYELLTDFPYDLSPNGG
jgi:Xaa-Pro aminopeptidase